MTTRITHWVGTLAFVVLTMSGLQIFDAAPYLDATDTNPLLPATDVWNLAAQAHEHHLFSIAGGVASSGHPMGVTQLFAWRFITTGWLGYASDGEGGMTARAFPGWITFPGYQDLASGRRWHFFFAWIFVLAGVAYWISGGARRDIGLILLRVADMPKLWPMTQYYLRLRSEPPEYGKYNPLQKLAYTLVLFVLAPLIVVTGLALSPGIDAVAHPLTAIFGGRQSARLWHFSLMLALLAFFGVHLVLVATTGIANNMRSMITGWYRLRGTESAGP
ncbi:MAG: cytochrome b/b6 domain-containing protein [Vulcanimicrobiaceae bacterium]